MTCIIPMSAHNFDCSLARDVPWVQVSGVRSPEKEPLSSDLDALSSVVEAEVWLLQALPVPSRASEQKLGYFEGLQAGPWWQWNGPCKVVVVLGIASLVTVHIPVVG
jgi:hypothetical protein